MQSFQNKVYRIVGRIPRGKVATYRWVAERMGNPGAARAVGNALNANPDTKRTPCHRVVRTGGAVGGYAFGTAKKIKKLEGEGITIRKGKIDLKKFGMKGSW